MSPRGWEAEPSCPGGWGWGGLEAATQVSWVQGWAGPQLKPTWALVSPQEVGQPPCDHLALPSSMSFNPSRMSGGISTLPSGQLQASGQGLRPLQPTSEHVQVGAVRPLTKLVLCARP